MTAAAPTSSETPILPFPVPRTPAFDRPPGMRGSRLPHHPETIAVVRLLYAHDAQAPRDRGTGRGLEDLGAWLGACGRLEAPARRAEKSPARPERPAGAPAQGPHAGEAPARARRGLSRGDGEGFRHARRREVRHRAQFPERGKAARAAAEAAPAARGAGALDRRALARPARA